MKVDTEEVKRHLDILGYTHIEPNLLDEFVKDLRKLIEYDQKHNNLSTLSSSINRDWDQSYSERLKTSTLNKNNSNSNQILSTNKQEFDQRKNKKHQNCTYRTSKMIDQHNNTFRKRTSTNESEITQSKCYFCGSSSIENQAKEKMKFNSNPSTTIYINATFNIEL
ncbi:uncharacterized protein LOC112687351 [Sipha flava]|uniref:Uncharacterized protein LOC112687351 n=1 Tax=Sipha flava TaxID=143950 RepID=A0A8B8FXS4_9HEMI|nr:uncharacterized protein LOC112687351 [Sipha flava]